jgi:predicted DNA-binding protein YlxM (UPF0122 family)
MGESMRELIDFYGKLLTENRVNEIINRYLTEKYGDVESFETFDNFGQSMIKYGKDGENLFTYYREWKLPTMSHIVFNDLCRVFSLGQYECTTAFDKWFSEKFNLEVDFKEREKKWNRSIELLSKNSNYNEFFGLKQPENWDEDGELSLNGVKDQIVGDLTSDYDISGIDKRVIKRCVDKFAKKWYNKVKNLDYDTAVNDTVYMSETNDWDEFLRDIGY